MAGDLQTTFSDIGGAVADIFSAQGAALSADTYRQAAKFSEQNAKYEAEATAIKEAQTTREAYLGLGATRADIGNSGFSASGSGLDLLRAGAQQASLARNLVSIQGNINVNSYEQQAAAERGQAASADQAAQGDIFGGILKAVGAFASVAPLFL